MRQIHRMKIEDFENIARNGRETDINFLLENLHMEQEFQICRMIDHALNLVVSIEGEERIRYFLFNGGNQIQRNYAALYFKRRGMRYLLEEAVKRGCIDEIQAFSS